MTAAEARTARTRDQASDRARFMWNRAWLLYCAPVMKLRLRRVRVFCPWLFAVTLLLVGQYAPEAGAALGDDASAIVAEQARLGASLQMFQRTKYAIHELGMPTGTRLRQFVGESGKVFAVSWSGGWRPNLRDIMGAHYDRFIAGTRGRRATRGIVRIELPGMVVVMGGRQRAFFGQVTLTDMLPAGLAPEDLR
jgi:hypothetical protein